MDKLKPEVREALRTLGNTCSSDCACVCIETRSPYVPTKCRLVGIIRDELHRLTARAEKAEAERDALREDAERLAWLQSYIDEYGGIVLHNGGIHEHSFSGLGLKNTGRTLTQAIDEARIVPEQEGSS